MGERNPGWVDALAGVSTWEELETNLPPTILKELGPERTRINSEAKRMIQLALEAGIIDEFENRHL